MAVQTHVVRDVSPLPPGRYWATILGTVNQADWVRYVRDMAGAVRPEATQLDDRQDPPSLFVVFNVPEGRAPFWNVQQFGFPNTAPEGVTTFQDVEQSEPVEDFTTTLENLGPKLEFGGAALLALIALLALSR